MFEDAYLSCRVSVTEIRSRIIFICCRIWRVIELTKLGISKYENCLSELDAKK